MEEILKKIKEHRKNRGISYEIMANRLKTSTSAYRKIEINETRLTVERLWQIAEILETKIEDLLNIKIENEFEQFGRYQQQIENYFQENKEKTEKIEQLYESRLNEKDAIIAYLQKIIASEKQIVA